MKKIIILSIIVSSFLGTAVAVMNRQTYGISVLSEQILRKAEELRDNSDRPRYDSKKVDEVLSDLKGLIEDYETVMLFAESPYPGEILLGTTPAGDDNWVETLCSTRYSGSFKEIRIRRTGSRARYLRINDIEIFYGAPDGPDKETFNENARVRLYSNGVFQIGLPRPMKVSRIRIKIEHESNGLEIYGIPFEVIPIIQQAEINRYPGEVLLGTTPPGDESWLETLCSSLDDKPFREIRLRRTGNLANYLRINDIEVTYITPDGLETEIFNQNGRVRLYRNGIFRLALPRPMSIRKIRVLISHESAGLEVYGLY